MRKANQPFGVALSNDTVSFEMPLMLGLRLGQWLDVTVRPLCFGCDPGCELPG